MGCDRYSGSRLDTGEGCGIYGWVGKLGTEKKGPVSGDRFRLDPMGCRWEWPY